MNFIFAFSIIWIGIFVAIIFHELGHFLTGKYYKLEPYFTTKKIKGVPCPAVSIAKGKKWPHKWSILNGFLFSFVGYPFYLAILEDYLNLDPFFLVYFSIVYFIVCILALGFIKDTDYDVFRNFDYYSQLEDDS